MLIHPFVIRDVTNGTDANKYFLNFNLNKKMFGLIAQIRTFFAMIYLIIITCSAIPTASSISPCNSMIK